MMTISTARLTALEKRTMKLDGAPPEQEAPPIDLEDLDAFLTHYYGMIRAIPEYFAAARRRQLAEIASYDTFDPKCGGGDRLRRDLAIQDAVISLVDAELTGVGVEAAIEAFKAADDMPCFRPSPWLFSLCRPPDDRTKPISEAARPHVQYVADFWETFWYHDVKSLRYQAESE
jgi:hypothetical protein